MASDALPKVAIAEILARKICTLDVTRLPEAVRAKCEDLLIDVVGLAVTARNEDYVKAALAACDDDGPCVAIGHSRLLSAAAAALVNGTAIHGEDFDDTFEGGPIHAGAVIVPAVLAACERHNLDGHAALRGIAVGVETMCRLSTVAPTLTHKAGFHPTAVFGAMGALPVSAQRSSSASGNWSMRSALPPRWRAASSNISPKARGPSGCTPAGRRNRGCAPHCLAAPALSGRARCSKACMASFTASPIRPRAITTPSPAILANAG